jgi:hypothetical protein
LPFVLLFGAAIAAAGQNTPSTIRTADVQQLQDRIDDAARAVAQAHDRDPQLATRLQSELDSARDEATYLKVKLQKNETVAPDEYASLRDKIADIQARASGEPSAGSAASSASADAIPVGTEFDVRLQTSLSSETAQPEDRFDATTVVDLSRGGRVLVPAGSVVRGMVSSVQKATRTERTGKLTVVFDRITIGGRNYPIHATVTKALESEGIKGETGKIGAGAGVGAIIGGILGGFKGALAGVLIGGGGTIAATEGTDVTLPAGTVLRARLDSSLDLK